MVQRKNATLICAFVECVVLVLLSAGASFAIEPWKQNPWYWAHDGKPVLLLGGSDDDNLFQWPKDKLIPQLDRIADAGGNVIRNTMSDRKDKGFEVYPFLRLENGKYDLSKWNPEYWQRFETLLSETARRGIFVQIEIWDRFDFTDARAHDPHRWGKHPYCPSSNVNYTFEQSGFKPRYPAHPGQNKQPFFFTTPKQRNNTVVLKYQEAYVNKLLDHALKYDHVLYCMDNETQAEPEWGRYWAELVHRRAKSVGKRAMVTEMWDDWNLRAGRHRQTFDFPDLYNFVDVSQNNHNKGQKHWDNFLFVREYLSQQPRPINTTKTYGASGNKFGHTDQDGIERFWRHLLAGGASIRFHRPDSGLGINDKAVACLRAARQVERLVPLWKVDPANELLADRQENEAYLAAAADHRVCIVYFPAAKRKRSVTLKLKNGKPSEALRGDWFDIDTGKPIRRDAPTNSTLTPPGTGNVVVVLRRE